MFGCVLPGRLVQTELQQIDETRAFFHLGNPEEINHICVFLDGSIPFQNGYAATIHLYWPGKGFLLLGMLSNDRPSAIYKVRGTFTSQFSANQAAFSAANPMAEEALLGIAIEPLPTVLQQCAPLLNSTSGPSGPVTKPPDATILAEGIVKHLFNFLSSFSSDTRVGPHTMVPLGTITKWYESIISKIRAGGTGFLERGE